jgi:NSS family neurotransmitter:Na+ symporter
MDREQWSSKLGFIFAVAGSAVGLANIWRFPYIAGHYGGAAFIILYLVCLFAIGFPTFIAEIVIGRKTHKNPAQAFKELGQSSNWGKIGGLTIVTGFLVSAFYSAVAGWISGYFVEAVSGALISFSSHAETQAHYEGLTQNPFWGVGFHFLFIASCSAVLYFGIKGGIERWNKVFMPLLFLILFALVFYGLQMEGSEKGLAFLLTPDFSALSNEAIIVALGQSFFTLSIGQGTLVTYGSYLSKNEHILSSSFPIVIMDTLVSLLSAVAIFTIVFSVGIAPDSGPALLFHTLPLVFSQIPAGYFVSVLFFLLVLLAALTSEISALEPSIAYLCDRKGWKRSSAVLAVGTASFLVGVPCALSTSLLKDFSIFSFPNILEAMIYLCSNVLIPLGGLAAVLLTGWKWGLNGFFAELFAESKGTGFVKSYFRWTLLYLSPLLIIVVFLNEIGFFG